jgi:hypothetical protein
MPQRYSKKNMSLYAKWIESEYAGLVDLDSQFREYLRLNGLEEDHGKLARSYSSTLRAIRRAKNDTEFVQLTTLLSGNVPAGARGRLPLSELTEAEQEKMLEKLFEKLGALLIRAHIKRMQIELALAMLARMAASKGVPLAELLKRMNSNQRALIREGDEWDDDNDPDDYDDNDAEANKREHDYEVEWGDE